MNALTPEPPCAAGLGDHGQPAHHLVPGDTIKSATGNVFALLRQHPGMMPRKRRRAGPRSRLGIPLGTSIRHECPRGTGSGFMTCVPDPSPEAVMKPILRAPPGIGPEAGAGPAPEAFTAFFLGVDHGPLHGGLDFCDRSADSGVFRGMGSVLHRGHPIDPAANRYSSSRRSSAADKKWSRCF